nr:sigma-70 family RNA polymerase sigma factor [Pontibacillus salipaludis]
MDEERREGSRIQDERLIEKIKAGHQQALRLLIERYKGHVFKVTYSVVRDEKEAEDLAQETFIKMMDALPSYQSQGFKTWLSRIAMNKAIDYKRKKARQKEDLAFETFEYERMQSAEEEWLEHEKVVAVSHSIGLLPANYQGVVQAYYIEGKSYSEIAREQALEEKTVEMRLYRARKWMKRNWKEDEF